MATANGSGYSTARGVPRGWRRTLHFGAAAGLVLSLAACNGVQLVPLQTARGNAALAKGSGVEVQTRSGTRVAAVPAVFTPVRLAIHNTGATPVYVELGDIQLNGSRGSLGAVRPTDIPARQRIASLGMDPGSPFIVQQLTSGGGPRIGRSESVLLEPHLGGVLPESSAGASGREEILHSAFQGGPIPGGETREGFIYFRAVPKDAGTLTLRVAVRTAPASAPASVVEILYAVQSG